MANFNGTIKQDNAEISKLNETLLDLTSKISKLPTENKDTGYILDFEDFFIDLYFSDNSKKAKLSIIDGKISISINNKNIIISSDGEILQDG